MEHLQKGSKKLIRAWASYDWANSVYFLVITSTIFPIYYGSLFGDNLYIDIFGHSLKNTALISYTTAAAFAVVAVLSPILSGIADYIGSKKSFMQFYTYVGALSCVGLYWFELDNIYFGLLCYFFASVGAWLSWVFYNSYLPDIAHPKQMDKASALGYSLGYVGSVLLLLVNLSMVLNPSMYGIEGSATEASIKAMKYSFVCVGVWWILFSQIAFRFLPKDNKSNELTKSIIFNGYRELRSVWKSFSNHPILKSYIGAFFVFSMAVQTVMLIAAYFGEQEVSWGSMSEKQTGLIISIMIIQLIAIIGAILTARFSEKFGNLPVLIALNFIWVSLCLYAFFVRTPIQFYIAAGFVGLSMGGIQSLARSTYSKYMPKTDDTASFFSFYSTSQMTGIVLGMLLFGTIDQVTGSMRSSILFFLSFFLIGAFLLIRIHRRTAF
ncbi:MAG: MFS transporter [Flavobacteriaceae bacterium]|nr:MFS transporter [Flavobacteriaceae bacterium]